MMILKIQFVKQSNKNAKIELKEVKQENNLLYKEINNIKISLEKQEYRGTKCFVIRGSPPQTRFVEPTNSIAKDF